MLKRQATSEEWELLKDLSFYDLCHDFAHRAREAGWTLKGATSLFVWRMDNV